MTMLAESSKRRFTYQDYLNWPPTERWEIIDGVARFNEVIVESEPYRILDSFTTKLHTYLMGYPGKVVSSHGEVCLPLGGSSVEKAIHVVRPDMVVFDRIFLDGPCCNGIPQFIAEMVSSASYLRDTQEKFQLYQQARIPEYWIIEPDKAMVTVFHLMQSGKYGSPQFFGRNDEIPVGFTTDFRISLQEIFDN